MSNYMDEFKYAIENYTNDFYNKRLKRNTHYYYKICNDKEVYVGYTKDDGCLYNGDTLICDPSVENVTKYTIINKVLFSNLSDYFDFYKMYKNLDKEKEKSIKEYKHDKMEALKNAQKASVCINILQDYINFLSKYEKEFLGENNND